MSLPVNNVAVNKTYVRQINTERISSCVTVKSLYFDGEDFSSKCEVAIQYKESLFYSQLFNFDYGTIISSTAISSDSQHES